MGNTYSEETIRSHLTNAIVNINKIIVFDDYFKLPIQTNQDKIQIIQHIRNLYNFIDDKDKIYIVRVRIPIIIGKIYKLNYNHSSQKYVTKSIKCLNKVKKCIPIRKNHNFQVYK